METSTTLVSTISTVTAAISPITAAATPSRNGRMRGFSATATRPRWKKIGKTNAGRKIPSVIASAPARPPAT